MSNNIDVLRSRLVCFLVAGGWGDQNLGGFCTAVNLKIENVGGVAEYFILLVIFMGSTMKYYKYWLLSFMKYSTI